MSGNTGTLRVTLTYDVEVDVTTPDGVMAWDDARTVAEARARYAAWLADGTCDVFLDMDGAPSAIVSVDVVGDAA